MGSGNTTTTINRLPSLISTQSTTIDDQNLKKLSMNDKGDQLNSFIKKELIKIFLNIMMTSLNKRGYHSGVTCDNCKQTGFKGPRYKCLVCPGIIYKKISSRISSNFLQYLVLFFLIRF
jgi:hypothetical protein